MDTQYLVWRAKLEISKSCHVIIVSWLPYPPRVMSWDIVRQGIVAGGHASRAFWRHSSLFCLDLFLLHVIDLLVESS
jgi:hypothetical protein